jgi:hypothetical protein
VYSVLRNAIATNHMPQCIVSITPQSNGEHSHSTYTALPSCLPFPPPPPLLQALLPVPPMQELAPRLRALWSGGRSFSTACWPSLFAVKALSNCNLMVLSRTKFTELLVEYPWVSAAAAAVAVACAEMSLAATSFRAVLLIQLFYS